MLRVPEWDPHLVPIEILPTAPSFCPTPPPRSSLCPHTFTDGAAQLLRVHLAGTVEGLAQDGIADHCALLGIAGTLLIEGSIINGSTPRSAL